MQKGFKELLESEVLSEDTKTALAEAWNAKLDEVREAVKGEVEAEVREEFSLRYEQDKGNLVEAMDRMLTDTVSKYATESAETTRALKEERAKLSEAIKEQRASYKAKLAAHTQMMEQFVLNQLRDELKEISEDHAAMQTQRVKLAQEISEAKATYDAKLAENMERLQGFVLTKLSEQVQAGKAQAQSLAESRVADAKKLREHRTSLNEQAAARINKLEGFVLEQLTKELRELETDKSNLVEAKVRLVAESKQALESTRKAFIERASKIVESTVEASIRKEMTQLKEDIVAARENIFGRRLFEAFQAEYMTSYLSEGTQVKKLTAKLQEAETRINSLATKLNESADAVKVSVRRVQIAEERASRVKTLNELLSPLSKEKRNIMGELLESVKTPNLKTAFQKYLPAVLNENVKAKDQGRRPLSEAAPAIEKKTVAMTGDRPNRLAESARVEDSAQRETAEIVELRRLAGIDQ
jgi:hypothetical protein